MLRKHRPRKQVDGVASPTNAKRAERAYRTLIAYEGRRRVEMAPELVRDLISDLMHLCDREKIDFDNELGMAIINYSAESGHSITIESMIALQKLEA